MRVLDSILDATGDTPLVRLPRITRGVKPTILAKLEMLNPGGSVKDRIGLRMIEAAERAGLLKPGGTIVEPTSGNTGHGLAIAAALRGYKCIFVMPDKMSQEKIALLRAYGAEVVITPTAVPPESPESYYRVADRLTEEIPGAFQPNQYFNQDNPAAHYATTGPEIWEQTDGRIDVLVVGVGTGGTITGTARYLKEQKPSLMVVGADPEGSLFSAEPGEEARPYLTEGIGEDFWPATFDPSVVDRWVRVSDRDSLLTARALTRHEGILSGESCGTAMFAALTVARDLPAETLMVVILPDTGRNYLSKLYSDSWMLQYGFLDRPEQVRVEEVLAAKHGGRTPQLVTVGAHDKVRQAVDRLQEFDISQAPVVRVDGTSDVTSFVGSVREATLLDRVFRDPDALQADVAEVMAAPFPMVEFDAPLEDAFAELQVSPAVLIAKSGEALGVLTRSDLLEFLAHRRQPQSSARSVRALGIDVGGPKKGLDVVVLDEDLTIVEHMAHLPVDGLAGLIRKLKPDVIAIDSPPAPAFPPSRSREAEKRLGKIGIHSYPTPSDPVSFQDPFREWMTVGFAAYDVARAAGFERFAWGRVDGTAIEIFPHATEVVLTGCLPSAKLSKDERRRRLLESHKVSTAALKSIDQVDAALAALTGLIALRGEFCSIGAPAEGVIVLPVREEALASPKYTTCVADQPTGQNPVDHLGSRCGCGDPTCDKTTNGEFAPGHDAKRKSILWRSAREGAEAIRELGVRGWPLPPEMSPKEER